VANKRVTDIVRRKRRAWVRSAITVAVVLTAQAAFVGAGSLLNNGTLAPNALAVDNAPGNQQPVAGAPINRPGHWGDHWRWYQEWLKRIHLGQPPSTPPASAPPATPVPTPVVPPPTPVAQRPTPPPPPAPVPAPVSGSSASASPVQISPPATQAHSYVAPNGSDSNSGTQASPWLTIAHAASVVGAGTTVHVAPGMYTQPVWVRASGNQQARIVFVSDTQWGAQVSVAGSSAGWRNSGNYIDVQGFDMTAPQSTLGISNEGSYNRIVGNRIHDVATQVSCQSGGGAIDSWNGGYSNHDADIIGNVILRTGAGSTGCTSQHVHGIYVAHAAGRVWNNVVSNASGYGIHCWHACTSIVVSNNTVFANRQGGIVIGAGDSPGGVVCDHSIVSNNIAINNTGVGIREYEYSGTNAVGASNQYLNNNVYGNSVVAFSLLRGHIPAATVTADAQFVDYKADGSGDYHLRPTSPNVGRGTSTGAPVAGAGSGFAAAARVQQGTGINIGALS
jgi:hypothetical protein